MRPAAVGSLFRVVRRSNQKTDSAVSERIHDFTHIRHEPDALVYDSVFLVVRQLYSQDFTLYRTIGNLGKPAVPDSLMALAVDDC